MNYLAHFYLSFDQEPLIVGNLLGDFVRGRLDHPRNFHFTTPIKQGILLHRHIDSFTDAHPVTEICRKTLPPVFSKYRGVVMDMYFDYFLAKHFADFHALPLKSFSQSVYAVLDKYRNIIPPEAYPMLNSMQQYDWLYQYQFIEGMDRSFAGMARRFPFLKGIDQASEELIHHEKQYEQHFRAFFPDLVSSCKDFLEI